MNRLFGILLIASVAWTQDAAKFEAADIRPAAKTTMPVARTSPVRVGRYEIKYATLVDLIRMAHGFEAEKVVGGPNWLELDRFDITAKVPAGSTPDDHKAMLRALLADRFKLVGHPEMKPMPTWALTVGKKPQMKESDGSEESGCKPQAASGAPAEGGIRLMMAGAAGGAPVTLNLGPGMIVTYQCRNITMAAFTGNLRSMIGTNLGPNAVLDETGLQGKWNFDIRYSMSLIGPAMGESGERISIQTAVEKQLGLKLEEKQVPTQVFVVEKANRDPGANPPGTAEALPPIPPPTEFEVASIKPMEPGSGMMPGGFAMQPGGRFSARGMPLRFLLDRAFNIMGSSSEQMIGVPQFAMSDRYDIIAKLPEESALAAPGPMDMDAMAPLIRKLLEDRFKLKYHTEERPVTAYTLVAAKPKLKKSDPASRINCKNTNAPSGAPPGSRLLACQNVTMAQFAERLQRLSPELSWPVADATGLEGSYDLSLIFIFRAMPVMMGPGMMRPPDGGGSGPASAVPTAADPTGGQTIFEAIEKQLGLKLEKRPRTEKVIVIDHLEAKPTEN